LLQACCGCLHAAVVLLTVIAGSAVLAAEPIVRISVSPETIELGESANMQITVLVPTWQPAPPAYPSFEIPNTITRLPADSSHPTSERVGSDTWSGIVRNYQVTPLIAADFSLGGESIRITWADPGKDNQVADIRVPAAALSVRIPTGAEALDPYLAGERFHFERTVTDPAQPLKAGDALVVRYRASLDGMPSIFLPPLAPNLMSNIATAYLEEPELTDGDSSAERLEQVTLVFEHGGQLELPGQSIAWWNTASGQIEEATIAPLVIEVAGPPPARDDPAALDPSSADERWPSGLLLAAVIAALAFWRLYPQLAASRRQRAEAHKLTEAYAFERVLQATDAHSAYGAALQWLARLAPHLTLSSFTEAYGNEDLASEVGALSRALFAAPDQAADHRTFVRGLAKARQGYLAEQQDQSAAGLAPLNPMF
jgi:hypothetical protein